MAGSLIPLVCFNWDHLSTMQGEDREYPPFAVLFDLVKECSMIKRESPVINIDFIVETG